jgi:hypothetical protein
MHNTIRGQIEIGAASAESIVLICDQNKRFDEFWSAIEPDSHGV